MMPRGDGFWPRRVPRAYAATGNRRAFQWNFAPIFHGDQSCMSLRGFWQFPWPADGGWRCRSHGELSSINVRHGRTPH